MDLQTRGVVEALVPSALAADTAAATGRAASPRSAPPARTRWKMRARLDAATSTIHSRHGRRLHRRPESKRFSTGHKPHQRPCDVARAIRSEEHTSELQ